MNPNQEKVEELEREAEECNKELSVEEAKELLTEINIDTSLPNSEILQNQLQESKEKYLRLFAEFDNYKKRVSKEKLDLIGTASKDLMISLLPIVDDFDRAKAASEQENAQEPFSEGINLVYQKLKSTLQTKGLKELDSNGLDFNSDFHEAITEIPVPTDDLKGKIVDTIEKGYLLHDKIIRYAKVVVGK